jgi:poly(A) polymerase
LAACAAHADGLDLLSRERIGHEMRKLLAARDPAPALATMQMAGILARLLPGADARAVAPLVHLEGDVPPDWLRRLACVGGEEVVNALRLSRPEARQLDLTRGLLGAANGPAEIAFRHGADVARDVMLLRAALLEIPLPEGWQADIQRGAKAVFPVRAADLPDLSGAALGARLREMEARWIAADFGLSREQLLA